jgi:hypothetical protein
MTNTRTAFDEFFPPNEFDGRKHSDGPSLAHIFWNKALFFL